MQVRREECDFFAALAGKEFGFEKLADVKDENMYRNILERYQTDFPDHCDRLRYVSRSWPATRNRMPNGRHFSPIACAAYEPALCVSHCATPI